VEGFIKHVDGGVKSVMGFLFDERARSEFEYHSARRGEGIVLCGGVIGFLGEVLTWT